MVNVTPPPHCQHNHNVYDAQEISFGFLLLQGGMAPSLRVYGDHREGRERAPAEKGPWLRPWPPPPSQNSPAATHTHMGPTHPCGPHTHTPHTQPTNRPPYKCFRLPLPCSLFDYGQIQKSKMHLIKRIIISFLPSSYMSKGLNWSSAPSNKHNYNVQLNYKFAWIGSGRCH